MACSTTRSPVSNHKANEKRAEETVEPTAIAWPNAEATAARLAVRRGVRYRVLRREDCSESPTLPIIVPSAMFPAKCRIKLSRNL